MHTTSLFSCLVPLGAALGDGRKSQVRGTTNERRAVCSETRMSSTSEFVGLKFCWSPTRLYRRVERVGTTAEPPTIDGGESQVNCSEPLQLKPPPLQRRGVLAALPTLRIFLSDTGEGKKIALVGDRQDFSTDVLRLRVCRSFAAKHAPHSHVVLNTPPQSKGAVPHLPSPAGR